MKKLITLLSVLIMGCTSTTRIDHSYNPTACVQVATHNYGDCLIKNKNTLWDTKRERQLADIICYDMMAAQTTLCFH